MMVWEKSQDELVNLCVAFRKAVVAELGQNPALGAKIMGAFTPEELKEFDRWSKEALSESLSLQKQAEEGEGYSPETLERLDQLVLDMSEKSAEVALRVLGEEELKGFVTPQSARTEENSAGYKARNYPYLARIFRP